MLPPPYVVKPIAEGSSVGVVIVELGQRNRPPELDDPGCPYGDDLMVERYVPDAS